MEVILHGLTKRFGRETIVQDLDHVITSGSRTVILGPNGSGKSTLLQLIAGAMAPTAGSIDHRHNGDPIEQDQVYRHVSIASPYLGLYEDLALAEVIGIHGAFKPFLPGITVEKVASIAYLGHVRDRAVIDLSSGMKQRLKLALAILSDTPMLLLDEPASNLDAAAIRWYRELLQQHLHHRTLIVASNHQPLEHDMCDRTIEMGMIAGRSSSAAARDLGERT